MVEEVVAAAEVEANEDIERAITIPTIDTSKTKKSFEQTNTGPIKLLLSKKTAD